MKKSTLNLLNQLIIDFQYQLQQAVEYQRYVNKIFGLFECNQAAELLFSR